MCSNLELKPEQCWPNESSIAIPPLSMFDSMDSMLKERPSSSVTITRQVNVLSHQYTDRVWTLDEQEKGGPRDTFSHSVRRGAYGTMRQGVYQSAKDKGVTGEQQNRKETPSRKEVTEKTNQRESLCSCERVWFCHSQEWNGHLHSGRESDECDGWRPGSGRCHQEDSQEKPEREDR